MSIITFAVKLYNDISVDKTLWLSDKNKYIVKIKSNIFDNQITNESRH